MSVLFTPRNHPGTSQEPIPRTDTGKHEGINGTAVDVFSESRTLLNGV